MMIPRIWRRRRRRRRRMNSDLRNRLLGLLLREDETKRSRATTTILANWGRKRSSSRFGLEVGRSARRAVTHEKGEEHGEFSFNVTSTFQPTSTLNFLRALSTLTP